MSGKLERARVAAGARPRLPAGALSPLAAAAERPDDLALVCGDQTLTFSQLAPEVAGAMVELSDRGAAPDAPVAVFADRRLNTAVALYALLELGAPVALLHPRSTPAEREALVSALLPELPPSRFLGPSWVRPAPRSPPPPAPVALDGRPQVIAFTSGSTGSPRGVELSRRAIAASAAASAAHLGWRPGDRWHAFLPIAHVGGLAILVRCLAARAPVVLEPEGRFDASEVLTSMSERGVTLASAVPAMLCDLVEAGSPPAPLRALLLGGAAAPVSLLDRAARGGWPVLTTYGMTETGSQIATYPAAQPLDPGRGIGAPLPGVELAIRGGRIFVKGEMLLSAYRSAGARDPAVGEDGYFDTGDLGELTDAGFLRVFGRADDAIITGGENVDPAEVEAALTAAPGVAAAVVAGIPDARLGAIVAAAVVPRAGEHRGRLAAVLDVRCRELLAPFKRPRCIEVWSELPTTPTGKPDRRAIRETLAARAAASGTAEKSPSADGEGRPGSPPRNPPPVR